MQGVLFFACSKRLRTRPAPTPTNISTNSEPLIEKNGTPASPATARANKVFPVPGGPTKSTPFGILAPTLINLAGVFKKSTTSPTSRIASSIPATSENLVVGISVRGWLLANELRPPMPPAPPCIRLMKKIQTPTRSNMSRSQRKAVSHLEGCFLGSTE